MPEFDSAADADDLIVSSVRSFTPKSDHLRDGPALGVYLGNLVESDLVQGVAFVDIYRHRVIADEVSLGSFRCFFWPLQSPPGFHLRLAL